MKKIISILISTGQYQTFIDNIIKLSIKKQSSYICIANVHMTIEAYWEPKFAEIVNNADFVTPDGMPLAKAMKLIYGFHQDRVAGMDLLPDLLKKAEDENLGVYFYGGTDELQKKTKEYVQKTYTKLIKRSYYFSPPFRTLTEDEENNIIRQINNSGAQLVFIALGCPKQEKWMASMKGKINACMIGIGGALPVMIGVQKRAPIWMQKLSLEWLYRFVLEPKRLFKRYLLTNSLFIYLLIKDLFKIYILKQKVI
jgi:N-acetylglucosaminyldiphosphoundecaprenol N-acetyl-beta-D-mannosaminyltransferase